MIPSSSHKKISVFLADLSGGGAERVMVNLANGLAAKNFSVDLLLVNATGPYLAQLGQHVQLIDLNSGKLTLSLPKLISYLKKERPDVLITALEDTNLIAIIAHQLARVPTRMVVTVHNNLTQESRYLKSLKRQIVPSLIRWVYPFADLVIAVSEGVSKSLQSLGIPSEQIRVIYNPILTPEFEALANVRPAHPWFSNSEGPIILGVGRLEPQKDFETLISAIALVQKQMPVRLMILGQGSQHQRLIEQCQTLELEADVAFPGFVENPLPYMAHASVCVLSSAWEGFGNVLVESMAVGTPVVSTDCPSGPAEILENGKYGHLVRVKDPEGLSKAILKTLEDPICPLRLKQRAAAFSLDKILQDYQTALLL